MEPDEQKPATPVDWRQYWGEYARPGPVLLGSKVVILVPEEFRRGALKNLLETAGLSIDEKSLEMFLTRSVALWIEAFKGRKGPCELARKREILLGVPLPPRGEAGVRLQASFEGRTAEASFGKVVAGRFGASRAGAKLAVREALLMGLEDLRKRDAEKGTSPQTTP